MWPRRRHVTGSDRVPVGECRALGHDPSAAPERGGHPTPVLTLVGQDGRSRGGRLAGSPAPSRCSPTPATWPPTRPRSCSPSGRRTSRPAGRAALDVRLHRAEILAALVNAVVLLGRVRLPGSTPASAGCPRPRARRRRGRWSRSRLGRPGRQRHLDGGPQPLRHRLAQHARARSTRSSPTCSARCSPCRRRRHLDDGLHPRRPDRVAGDRGADPARARPAADARGRARRAPRVLLRRPVGRRGADPRLLPRHGADPPHRHRGHRAAAPRRARHLGQLLGQEAAQIGAGRALRPQDYVFPTYREHGVAWCRGVDPLDLLGLFRGVDQGGWDPNENNFHLYTIVIGAQTLHATGYAMGMQRDGVVGTGDPDRDAR
jgi:hypothetical protein